MARKSIFKACKNCKALVSPEQEVCPICGSSSFSDDWEGVIIIINTDSEVAKIAEVQKPWRYAIIVK
ncbi:MAG: transcription elongation factor subunit Spt4 [Saccharolobus sp.]|jgi:DNA-directed RNA polymerase subunit E"|uniref:Transcription elongation factor Spt4 n=1 Tax=Saccharolobus caldissimus TaxID=1702097 RepID=A0AAQ4CP65_9CREN|nr:MULTISPECIES: transcription elongation factor subunit Spt4 [Saccharolobus]MDT7860772.1 transcription elongation factor subunit Spt4 [Saccharolobus sp.]BDB97596.1 DNA-binding protein [Saccharolobus caldissimus]